MSSMGKPLFGMVTCYNFVDTKLVPAGKTWYRWLRCITVKCGGNVPPEDHLQTKYQQGELCCS